MIVLDLSILNQKGTPMFYSDTFVNRPAFGIVGRIFISIDTKEIFRDTGIAWELVSDAGAGSSNLQQVTDNGSTTTNAITAGGYTATNLAGGGSQMLVVDNAGVFGVQAIPTSTNIYNSDGTLTAARTVSLNGHNLLFSGGASVARLRLDANNNVARIFSFATANVARWAFRVDGNETGSNAGADFAIRRYNDAGTIIDAPISINRATGGVSMQSLAGGGTQFVSVDNAGLLSAVAAPTSANIYNSDGTLTGARNITFGGNNLTFIGSSFTSRFTASGKLLIGTTTEPVLHILDINGSPRCSGDFLVSTNMTVGRGVGTSNFKTILGVQANQNHTTGDWITAVGYQALRQNNAGNFNSAFGSDTLSNANGTSSNSAFGFSALRGLTSGNNNTAIGRSAGYFISGGTVDMTNSSDSIFIGHNSYALANSQTNQIVIGATAVGLGSNTTIIGTASTVTAAIRGRLLLGTTTDTGLYQLDAVGLDARINTIRVGLGNGSIQTNTGVGRQVLNSVNTGSGNNSAFGYEAMRNNTTGSFNNAFGQGALQNNTTGVLNCAFGNAVLNSNNGSQNSSFGTSSFINLTSGSKNVAIGNDSGRYTGSGSTALTSVDNSIYIGFQTRSFAATGITNEIVIGHNVVGLGSNTTILGNSSTLLTSIAAGQLRLASYLTTTSYTGTLVGLLGFDASGNVLTIAPEVASQSGQTGKFLTTDGTNTSWATISGGNIYNTDGTLTGNRVVTLGLNNLTFDGSAGGDIIYSDATNIQLGSVTGTKFGTTTAEKLAFYGLSPIAQQTTSVTAGAFVQNSTNAVYQDSTFSGYTIGQIVEALRFLGLLA